MFAIPFGTTVSHFLSVGWGFTFFLLVGVSAGSGWRSDGCHWITMFFATHVIAKILL
jgi:hypothetical protein